MHELESALVRSSQISFGTFKRTVDIRASQASFINSKIHKEVMRRTRLRNKFIDSKTDADRIAYNEQRTHCVSLIRKEKKSLLH